MKTTFHGKILVGLFSALLIGCGGGGSGGGTTTGGGKGEAPSTTDLPITATATCRIALEPYLVRSELAAPQPGASPQLLTRFVQMSDEHIMDDDGALINGASPLDATLPLFESAQRFQDEYTDEVMNAMIRTINGCNEAAPVELVLQTGDNTDLGTVAELRRFIDNLDGSFDRMSAFEQNCRAALPAGTTEEVAVLNCTRFTGRGTADTQTPDPNPDDLTYQLLLTRVVRQLLDTELAVLGGRAADGSTDPARSTLLKAPGMPQELRCEAGSEGCTNLRVDVPYYTAFGNHDGYIRGTLATEPGLQEVSIIPGRHYLRQQHEFIDEFFVTSAMPGPVGHGFNHVDAARMGDANGRNDGYYAFNAGNGNRLRMIVLNTIIDGADPALPLDLRNPFALADGTIDQDQFEWLKTELAQAQANGQLVLAFSHHPDLTFSEFGTLAALAPKGVPAATLDAELASYPNVVAWIAGHTHMNRIRAFKVADGTGSNGSISAPVACKGPGACSGFWQIETASLIDFPQEQRILEIFDNGNGTGTIRSGILQHDFERSKALAARDDMCQFYLTDPAALQQVVSDGGLSFICAQGGTRDGEPTDRNVELLFRMP